MKTTVLLLSIVIASSAYAAMGAFLSQETIGEFTYCKYSNGVVIKIHSYKVCPVTIN